jgi:hypothetical protein
VRRIDDARERLADSENRIQEIRLETIVRKASG